MRISSKSGSSDHPENPRECESRDGNLPVPMTSTDRSRSYNGRTHRFGDVCTNNAAINTWLARHQKFRAFVDNDGTVIHVPDPFGERTLHQLLDLVRTQLGQSVAKPISLVEFSQLRVAAIKATHVSETRNDLVEMILREAIDRSVSDIYIGIHRERCRVYFRTHGVRYLFSELAGDDGREMARAIWAIAPHGQFEQQRPTDTAFDFAGFRVRANSLPDTRGNSVVLRLREPSWIPSVDALGYDAQQLRLFREIQACPGGLSVISGETNSGKSTTLTSLMSALTEAQMVIEIADPIEMEFDHVTHIEIDHYAEDADATFRDILGGLVRQNPDTLFIGEIRDAKTAEAAVNMSLQGKRVWGTVHAQSCLSSLSRLQHLGIDAELLAQPGFLNGIVNQSLVPVVCDSCCSDTLEGDEQQTRQLREKFGTDAIRFHHPDGCPKCIRGIRGQTVVAEVMVIGGESSHPVRPYIRDGDYASIETCMQLRGLCAKSAHAADKIRQGQIDPLLAEEVIGPIRVFDITGVAA